MNRTDVQRYLGLWRLRHPQGVVSRAYLTDRDDELVQLHRRAWLGARPGIPTAARMPLEAWLASRWLARSMTPSAIGISERVMRKFEDATGMPRDEQLARLKHLMRGHGIPPVWAYRFGLLVDGARWQEFAFDYEVGWNSAASEGLPNFAPDLRDIQNKTATARRLADLGIPVIDAESLSPAPRTPADVDALVSGWLERWPAVFVKRRDGSRGEGSFRISPSEAGWEVTEYQGDPPEGDPRAFIAETLSAQPYLAQPLLRSHPLFDGIAGGEDVVTIRIVTRQIGGEFAVFSAALEVPLEKSPGSRTPYHQLVLGEAGTIGDPVGPVWMRVSPEELTEEDLPESESVTLEERRIRMRAYDQVAATLKGRTVPEMAELRDFALRAHREFAGMFAIAWDVAVTDAGFRFLEGNSGFGTLVPQQIAGGLLRGWARPSR